MGNETRRLLKDLQTFEIRASHVVVNQLVSTGVRTSKDLSARLPKALSLVPPEEFIYNPELEDLEQDILSVTELFEARQKLQQKYLSELKGLPEVKDKLRVIEMPLLRTEVTGAKMLSHFSQLLASDKS